MDLSTEVIQAGVLAYASKDMISKVLGPSADYLGQETKHLIEKCNINISKIFYKAYQKLRQPQDENHKINLRVLKNVIDEGKMIEDELLSHYYAGMLCSGRSPDGEDDTGVFYLSIIKGLSRYQVSIHYILYSTLLRHIKESFIDLRKLQSRESVKIFIPEPVLQEAFACEAEDIFRLATHSLTGLSGTSLITSKSFYTEQSFYNRDPLKLHDAGLYCGPTVLGTELFLNANGITDVGIHQVHNLRYLDDLMAVDRSQVKVLRWEEQKKL